MKSNKTFNNMSGVFEKVSMRNYWAFSFAILFLILVLITVSFASYMEMKTSIISDIDSRLFVGAVSIKKYLPKDFHDRARTVDSISQDEDNKNIRVLSEFANTIDFEYLYTLIYKDNSIYITSSNATEEELANNEQVRFFTLFDEADPNFDKAFVENTPVSFTHKDRWGTFRAFAIPQTSPKGQKYLSVAEYNISDIDRVLTAHLIKTLIGAAIYILGVVPLFYVFLRRIRGISEKQRKMEERLRQAQKMESIGRLAGGVAHDYNNISSIILGYAELALEQLEDNNPLREDITEIFNAANRSTNITRQLLAFARKQNIAPKVLNLNETVESLLKMIRRLIGEDIDVVWRPGREIWSVKIDPTQVDQIMTNLCVNARDAIEDVGKLTIETKNISFDDYYCYNHSGFNTGEYVMISVSDTGRGISKDDIESIFEPFFTTKETGKGTGLGLATIYGIVQQNEGFINARSELGKGTTFEIYLSRYTGETLEKNAEVASEIPLSNGKEFVLLVEDDVPILKLGKRILEELGYNVFSFTSPIEALGFAKEHAGDISLLITDVIMPEMNGHELSEKIQQPYPFIKVLFMSGYTADVIDHLGVLEDGFFFINKPFSKKDFAVKVRDLLDAAGNQEVISPRSFA